MPFKGDFGKLDEAEKGLESVAQTGGRGRAFLDRGIAAGVKALLREQFSKGIAPDGTPLQKTVRGQAALISKRLPGAFKATLTGGLVEFVAKTKRDLLDAHQEGHTFAERQAAERQQYLSFTNRGKLVAERRLFKRDGTVRKGAYQVYARAHRIGARVLPQRLIVPIDGMPARWDTGIKLNVEGVLTKYLERLVK